MTWKQIQMKWALLLLGAVIKRGPANARQRLPNRLSIKARG